MRRKGEEVNGANGVVRAQAQNHPHHNVLARSSSIGERVHREARRRMVF